MRRLSGAHLRVLHPQVLERALRCASSRFNTDASNPTIGFVRLSGALHCDERSAFQEIAHQLCRWAKHMLLCSLLPACTYRMLGGSPSAMQQSVFAIWKD